MKLYDEDGWSLAAVFMLLALATSLTGLLMYNVAAKVNWCICQINLMRWLKELQSIIGL